MTGPDWPAIEARPATRYGRDDAPSKATGAVRDLLRAIAAGLVFLALATADSASDPRYLIVLAGAFVAWAVTWIVVAVLG